MTMVAAMVPPVPSKSRFEINRLAEAGDEWAKRRKRRLRYWKDIISLLRLIYLLLLLLYVLLAVGFFGWAAGAAASAAGIIITGLAARVPLVRRQAMRLYRHWEPGAFGLMRRYHKLFWWLRVPVPELFIPAVHSKAELEHLIEAASNVFTLEEKTLLLHSIRFVEKRAKDSMTPRRQIESIKKSEMLGPLVLDGLHKSGHSCFPVIYGDIDHVVGVLYLAEVLTIDTSRKHTAMVETAMDKQVLYIHEDRPLVEALSILLEAHRHVLIVVNDEGKTMGLLTLGDIIKTLFGYRLTHEEATHDEQAGAANRD